MIKSGTYLIYNVEYEKPLYYDEQEKRLQVVQPGQLATKFYLDFVGSEESLAYTIQYLKQGTYAHVHLAPGNEGTEAACYPFVEVDNVDPVIWRVILINNTVVFMIKVYAGGYGEYVWTTSENGVMVLPIDEEHETQQQFFITWA